MEETNLEFTNLLFYLKNFNVIFQNELIASIEPRCRIDARFITSNQN